MLQSVGGSGALLQSAMEFAGYGWRVVPLHAVRADGSCSCNRGADCAERSRGKHPRIKEWQHNASASEEQIVEWWDRWPEANVGVKLGPESGIVDIEFDTDEGRSTADRLLGDCITPTYRSDRSVHRLFRWSTSFAGLASKIDRYGLEFRLGTDAKGMQSVFPPSTHHSGRRYEWLPGLSPGEVQPIDVPEGAMALLWNDQDGTGLDPVTLPGKSPEEWERIYRGSSEGSRNQDMASIVGKLLITAGDLDNDQTVKTLFEAALSHNGHNVPPLTDSELKTIFTSILKKERSRRLAQESGEFLKPRTEDRLAGEPSPTGEMRLVIVESDPPMFELHAPQFARAPGSLLLLTADEMVNKSALRAQAVKQAFYLLPDAFMKMWFGKNGYCERLMFNATTKPAPLEEKRGLVIAQWLWEKLSQAKPIPDAGPGRDGRPCRLPDGSVIFLFNRVWGDMEFSPDKVKRIELSNLLKKLHVTWYSPGAGDAKFKRISKDGLRMLNDMLSECDPESPEPNREIN